MHLVAKAAARRVLPALRVISLARRQPPRALCAAMASTLLPVTPSARSARKVPSRVSLVLRTRALAPRALRAALQRRRARVPALSAPPNSSRCARVPPCAWAALPGAITLTRAANSRLTALLATLVASLPQTRPAARPARPVPSVPLSAAQALPLAARAPAVSSLARARPPARLVRRAATVKQAAAARALSAMRAASGRRPVVSVCRAAPSAPLATTARVALRSPCRALLPRA